MDKTEFAYRRQVLLEQMGNHSIAIVPTAPERLRNRDVNHPYRPDSDFYYLTGFAEPESLAVLIPKRPQGQYLLFCREQDIEKETWHGRRAGLEGACEIYGADDAFPITDIDDIVPGLLENKHRLYYSMGYYPELDHKILEWTSQLREKERTGVSTPKETVALDHLLHNMRLHKREAEIAALRHAIAVTIDAHQRAMRVCRPGLYEYQLEAEIIHEFMRQGCRAAAYPSIVGSGENTCILHYIDNTALLREGDLVLIDAGAEFDYYAADITRTFPVNGRFSEPQRAIYELVLQAQYAIIDTVRPGVAWNQLQKTAVRVLTEGLVELGLLQGNVETLIEKETYKRFYMHRSGHWLGMDVHDVGGYKVDEEWHVLEAGMVLTVEPGLYIPAGTPDVPEAWWNIGVRIEDDVLVTEQGREVLTEALPKTVAEIEALMVNNC